MHLHHHAVQYPRRTIVIGVLLSLAVAPGLLHLRIRTDGQALVPVSAPEVLLDRSIREAFGVTDWIIVVVESGDQAGIFNTATLGLISKLTTRMQEIDGVRSHNVWSLATEYSDRVWPGTLRFRRYLEPLPATSEETERLRNDLREIRLYRGTLVSVDEKAATILVGVSPGMDRGELLGAIHENIAALRPFPERTHVIGAPVAEALLGIHILEDLGVPTAFLGHRTHGPADPEAAPSGLYSLRLWISRHVGLVPIALLVMALVFLIAYKSCLAVALPMVEVGACLVFVFGLMGWCGVPVYLTIAVMPVILTAIGIADEIHIFGRYRNSLAGTLAEHNTDDRVIDHRRILVETMDEMRSPVIKTSITTAVGFLAFAMSPIPAVRAFGVFTAIGIAFCMLWSLSIIPAQLSLINPRRFTGKPTPDATRGTARRSMFERWAYAAVRWRLVVFGATVVVLIAAVIGIGRVNVQDSWIDGFAPDSEFHQATLAFNNRFLGSHTLMVCVDTGGGQSLSGELGPGAILASQVKMPRTLVGEPRSLIGQWLTITPVAERSVDVKSPFGPRPVRPWSSVIEGAELVDDHIVVTGSRRQGSPLRALRLKPGQTARYEISPQPLKHPDVIRRIEGLEAFIETHRDEAVGGVLGTASYIKTLNFMTGGHKEVRRSIPDNPYRIEWLWRQYERVRGVEHRRQLVTDDYARSLTTIFLNSANYRSTQRLMDAIRLYAREHLEPHGLTVSFAGDVAVSQAMIHAIVTTQVRSLTGSLVGVFLVAAILTRSVVWGILTVIPCALATLINFAVMGYLSIPLGVATSMFASMTLGIGVDYAIHLLDRFRLSRSRGMDSVAALADAMRFTVPAVLIDAVAVALGFGVLVLSQVPANARLGGLVVLSIVTCVVATLVLLPALLVSQRSASQQSSAQE